MISSWWFPVKWKQESESNFWKKQNPISGRYDQDCSSPITWISSSSILKKGLGESTLRFWSWSREIRKGSFRVLSSSKKSLIPLKRPSAINETFQIWKHVNFPDENLLARVPNCFAETIHVFEHWGILHQLWWEAGYSIHLSAAFSVFLGSPKWGQKFQTNSIQL